MVGPDTILDDEAEAVPFTELLLVVDPYDGVDPDLVDLRLELSLETDALPLTWLPLLEDSF